MIFGVLMSNYPSQKSLPWEGTKVLVVGDLILDEYLDGTVNRISPEAPVPVHLVRKTDITAGGAANVARNIKLVGGHVLMIGVCGKDAAAEQLKGILERDYISTELILTDSERPTVRKTRITANHQQLVRVDWEETKAISQQMQAQLLDAIKSNQCDAILVSDYGKGSLPKGFVQQIISYAQAVAKPVIIDPKGKDYSVYAGCDLITPNRKEALEALGLDANAKESADQLALRLQSQFNLKNVLVTLGAEGMYGLSEEGENFHLPAVTREVFDVSGAGDTVVSLMALSMASSLSVFEGMKLANLAAGKVVEKWGTQPITKQELFDAMAESNGLEKHSGRNHYVSSVSKIIGQDELVTLLSTDVKKDGHGKKRVVFTNGCFDLLHAGHLSYLETAKSFGDILVIGINSDNSVTRLKGPTRPIISAAHRSKLLAGLACVDYVVQFDEDTPESLIRKLRPSVLVKGADYEISEIVGADFVQDTGGQVERVEFVEDISTSHIVSRIKNAEQSKI
jgi:D-beta-D-heptose 7-phosphate kinase/D-beta-D-heptose 1-phosphate adenosyltransferase